MPLRPPTHALPLLQAALRPGDEPGHGLDQRGNGDVPLLDPRRGEEPARGDARARADPALRSADPHQRGARADPGDAPARLRAAHAVHALQGGGPGRRAAVRPRHPVCGGRGRRAKRRQPDRPVGPGHRAGARAHPHAPGHRGGAPPPGPRGPAHPVRDPLRDRGGPGRLALRAAGGLRGRRHQPLPGLRVHRGDRGGGDLRPRGHRLREGSRRLPEGLRQGPAQDHGEDGDLDAPELPRRPDLRGRGARPGAGGPLLLRHRVTRLRGGLRRRGPGGGDAPRARLSGTRLHLPGAGSGGALPVAASGRAPHVQSGHRGEPAARRAPGELRHLQGVLARRRRRRRAAVHPARPAPLRGGRRAHSPRGGGAGQRDRQALLHGRHVLRVDLARGPPDPGDRDESPGREEQHRRRRGGPGPLHAGSQRAGTWSTPTSSRSRSPRGPSPGRGASCRATR